MNPPVVAIRFLSQIQGVSQTVADEFDQLRASINAGFATLTSAINAINPVKTGTIIVWSGFIIPAGYLKCDGTAYSRSFYGALFAVTGTVFGAGDGTTTFNVPNIAAVVANCIYLIKT